MDLKLYPTTWMNCTKCGGKFEYIGPGVGPAWKCPKCRYGIGEKDAAQIESTDGKILRNGETGRAS